VKRVRVGIVSWNTRSLLDRCLTALPAALEGVDATVVVVDNASSDGSPGVAARHRDVRVMTNAENVGYARAMNQALAGADADVLVALNPDTEPAPGSLATLAHRLMADGLAPHDCATDIDWAVGAVHVIRAGALEGEEPYDERWFMYVEDVDLCWRLAQRGWRRRLEPDACVVHVGNASGFQAWGDARTDRWMAATYDWYARTFGRPAMRRWAAVNATAVAVQLVGALPGALLGSARRRARARDLARSFPRQVGAVVEGRYTSPPTPTLRAESPA